MSNIGYNKGFLDREASVFYKGICAILIMLYHTSYAFSSKQIYNPLSRGGISVAVFFFLSGYGLMSQFSTKDNYLKNFVKKRILPLFIEVTFFSVIYWIVHACCGNAMSLKTVILNMVYYGSPLVRYSWYIYCIMLFYMFFFVCGKIARNTKVLLAMQIIFLMLYVLTIHYLSWYPHWYGGISLFIIGQIVFLLRERIGSIVNKFFAPILVISFVLFILMECVQDRFDNIFIHTFLSEIRYISFAFTFFVLFSRFTLKNKVVKYLGTISLEIYLSHGLFLFILPTEKWYVLFPCEIISTLLFSFCVYKGKTWLKKVVNSL